MSGVHTKEFNLDNSELFIEMKERHTSRRGVMKSIANVAVASLGIGTVGSANARSRRRSRQVEDHGGTARGDLVETIKRNLENRNFQTAERICEMKDIRYDHSVVNLGSPRERESQTIAWE